MNSFEQRIMAALDDASAAERRVYHFFRDNREEVLVSSAMSLAEKTQASDATVIRAAKSLGYAGMEEMRRAIADELRASQTPASRLTRTLTLTGDDVGSALTQTIDVHIKALEELREGIPPAQFSSAIESMVESERIMVFGIGPSSAIADYFVIQLRRFGFDADSLKHTGLLCADDLRRLRRGDSVVILAYDRVYYELDALLDYANQLGLKQLLVTDTLVETLRHRVTMAFRVARGRASTLSLHAATLGLLEAFLVGLAVRRPAETVASLASLNRLRAAATGKPMDLPIPTRKGRRRSQRRDSD